MYPRTLSLALVCAFSVLPPAVFAASCTGTPLAPGVSTGNNSGNTAGTGSTSTTDSGTTSNGSALPGSTSGTGGSVTGGISSGIGYGGHTVYEGPQSETVGTCIPGTQPSDTGGFSRQSYGAVDFSADKFGLARYIGGLDDLGAVVGGVWPSYKSGFSVTLNINSNCYVALAFTPTSPGTIQFVNDSTYGDGGLISVSTVPGQFNFGEVSTCSYQRGSANSLIVATPGKNPNGCQVQIGTTYYVNFQGSDGSGNATCFAQDPRQCAATLLSYSLTTSEPE